jgi:folate-binding protein YgfZ
MPAASEPFFVRLRITGKDRAKFLHNFCTNDVKGLLTGTACEAFFTDVKARILAHGYVLAFNAFHEIWMLPGDSSALTRHLSKYVITEDVTVTDLSKDSQVLVLRDTAELIALPPFHALAAIAENTQCGSLPESTSEDSNLTVLRFSWASERLIAVAGSAEKMTALRQTVSTNATAEVTGDEFERLRIGERFPVIGRDMGNENLAPEAERNSISISYTKGCYLGQEPIARLDAMGHVNRALRVIELSGDCPAQEITGRSLTTADGSVVGIMTSVVRGHADAFVGLAMVKVSSILQPLFCELTSGTKLSGRCRPL